MFTGIIEALGTIVLLQKENTNLHLTVQCSFTSELKIDQSISHNGVCLTVVAINGDTYRVTAVLETLQKSNLGKLNPGDKINLERSMKLGDRLDGHLVQGHIDTTALLSEVKNENGSYLLTFSFEKKFSKYIIQKGSICINGISLTVMQLEENCFSVIIIPYTWQNTNLKNLHVGETVNIEFDIIGKYVEKMMLK
ncbi:MAG: riboflavin synthase [Chitinophagales bacterium]